MLCREHFQLTPTARRLGGVVLTTLLASGANSGGVSGRRTERPTPKSAGTEQHPYLQPNRTYYPQLRGCPRLRSALRNPPSQAQNSLTKNNGGIFLSIYKSRMHCCHLFNSPHRGKNNEL